MLRCQSPLFGGNVFMHSYKMIVIRHDATVNMLWKKFAIKNLKVNSETKSLSQNAVQNVENKWRKTKTPCFSLWDVFENTSTANIKLYNKKHSKGQGVY